MESCKAQINKQWTQLPLEIPWHFGKKMTQVYDQWNIKGSLVAKLQRIEGLLTGLPVSKSPAIQAISSSVCEQADDVRKNMLGFINEVSLPRFATSTLLMKVTFNNILYLQSPPIGDLDLSFCAGDLGFTSHPFTNTSNE
ncbi:unnamed protein product [Lactuca saligna]|uniref:Uncharacterized protein n=1 Tax=Lactuca saligna TaxID=75948 RepID=A0AA35YJ47_LACSI|nr:unnamed protein product [Lactuca saligna]